MARMSCSWTFEIGVLAMAEPMTLPDARARVERLRDNLGDPDSAWFHKANHAALSRVLAELDRLPRLPTLEQVRSIEWIAGVEGDQCPACTHARERGRHAKDCWIARLTAALETP